MLRKTYHTFAAYATSLLLASSLHADCTYQLFSLSSSKGTLINEFIDQLSDECGYTVLITDREAESILKKRLNKTNLQDLIMTEVLDIILRENNLDYKLENNILKISYITTKTYHLDYIISERKGKSSTNIMLSSTSGSGDQARTMQAGTSEASQGQSETGLEVTSTDDFQLWNSIQLELQSILNRPEDKFEAQLPILNKEAGLITVSATLKQIKRLDKYIQELQDKLKSQVMIDVHLYSVTLNDAQATGIDWGQIFSLQNFKVSQQHVTGQNAVYSRQGLTTIDTTLGSQAASIVDFTGVVNINDLVKYLKEQGDVRSVSNPKVLTLNNQPALISVGNQLFYKITRSSSQATAGGSTIMQNDIIDSVFAGILLDITPEISTDGRITLKINPSISDVIDTVSSDTSTRTLPPDLTRKQLSSVVTARDGEQVVLGGLIGTSQSNNVNKVPLLGDIPLIGSFFRSSRYNKVTTELVVVITPKIIHKETALSLKELGYKGILDSQVQNNSFISSFNNTLLEDPDAK